MFNNFTNSGFHRIQNQCDCDGFIQTTTYWTDDDCDGRACGPKILEEEFGQGLDGDVTLPTEEAPVNEVPSELESRLDVLEKIEGERVMEHRVEQLDGVLSNLESKYPDYLGDQEKVGEFLEFADGNAEKFVENGMPNLERAFREWSYGQLQEQLSHYKKLDKNGARNKGKVIGTAQVGAKEVKSPKKYAKWNDVSMDDPEIAKYFDD